MQIDSVVKQSNPVMDTYPKLMIHSGINDGILNESWEGVIVLFFKNDMFMVVKGNAYTKHGTIHKGNIHQEYWLNWSGKIELTLTS